VKCILGIDPGISGAIAFYFPDVPDRVLAEDVPTVYDQIAAATLFDRIKQMNPDVAVIELVSAMPKQGVSSTFKFGRSFGTVIGVVQAAGIPLHFVTPAKWKRHFNLTADKECARELALRMFAKTPEHFARKKDHGRAEAALIARYAAETILSKQAA
jgi:crossover junction endodeoxyribonuclease RuvC